MKLYISGHRPHRFWELIEKMIIVCACAVAQCWVTWESRRDVDPECSVLSESIASVWLANLKKRFHQRIRTQPFFTRVCCQALLAMSEAACTENTHMEEGSSKFTV